MKATLTIEVPDDFKKGDKRCKYRYMYAEGRNACCDLVFCMECNAENCPLEIQENKCSFTPINDDSIELKVDDIEPFATVGRIFVTSPDHWCRIYYDCVDCELYEGE